MAELLLMGIQLALAMLAALFFGLWLGERGQRKLLTNLVRYGTASVPAARRLGGPSPIAASVTRDTLPGDAPGETIEVSEEMVEKGLRAIKAEYANRGMTISDDEALEQVKQMLASVWTGDGGEGGDGDDLRF